MSLHPDKLREPHENRSAVLTYCLKRDDMSIAYPVGVENKTLVAFKLSKRIFRLPGDGVIALLVLRSYHHETS